MEASLSELYSNVRFHMEDREISSDNNSGDSSPSSTTFNASESSPKRRRSIQKKVVTFPLKEIEGSRFKGDFTPPSDSWAWRKYGQKPIKGSPFPRGYYRCSSSKGCPARKQVERSRSDPNTLVVTYSYEHNHPWPLNRSHHHQNRHNNVATTAPTTISSTPTTDNDNNVTPTMSSTTSSLYIPSNTNNSSLQHPKVEQDVDERILFQQNKCHHDPLLHPTDELTWFSTDHPILENNSFFNNFNDLDMSKNFPMREEEDALFADLGELPECSVMFRRAAGVATVEECNLAPTTWCGTMG